MLCCNAINLFTSGVTRLPARRSRLPLFVRATVEGNSIRAHFTNAEGLTSRGNGLGDFEVAGKDGDFFPAKARIELVDGVATVIASSPNVAAQRFIRYSLQLRTMSCVSPTAFDCENLNLDAAVISELRNRQAQNECNPRSTWQGGESQGWGESSMSQYKEWCSHAASASAHDCASKETTRREFLQGSVTVVGSLLAGSAVQLSAAEVKPKQPNIVFFLGEGQRHDALSIAGNPILKTPNHDRIGREGVMFRNAFCTNALCAPARATLLTGLYSRSTGALGNDNLEVPLPADIPLFTDLLHDAGYEIAIVGKVHIHNGVEERHWDYYFGHNAAANNFTDPFFKEGRNGEVGEQKQYMGLYPDDLAVERALAWLRRRQSDKPFCLLVWFVAPHEPFTRPRRHFDLYSHGTVIPKPATFDDDLKGYPGKPPCFVAAKNKIGVPADCASLEGMVKNYYAGLVAVDENIGRVLDYLEEQNILDDTAIVHTSDHGYFLGEWRLFDKRLMHEPSIRVPLMIRYPKRIPAGTIRDETILDIDLAPTILDLAGVRAPASLQGRTMIPLARASAPRLRDEWYYHYYEVNKESPRNRGIRTDQYKLIDYYAEDPQQFELYDLANDPGERMNLYGNPHYATQQQKLWNRLQEIEAAIPERPAIGASTVSGKSD